MSSWLVKTKSRKPACAAACVGIQIEWHFLVERFLPTITSKVVDDYLHWNIFLVDVKGMF